jgi:hypothetical protein
MKKIGLIIFGAGIFLLTACEGDRNTATNDTITETSTHGQVERSGTTAAGGMDAADHDSLYRREAIQTTNQMAADLNLDEEAQEIAEEIFYHRARRRAEVKEQFADNEYRFEKEMQEIEESVDQQLLGIMSYEQQKNYVQHRENYLDVDEQGMWTTGANQASGVAPANTTDVAANQAPADTLTKKVRNPKKPGI